MKYLQRFKLLPLENILFFSFYSLFFFSVYRFVFPLASQWFYPAFLLQFLFGFLPQLHSRKFGRIFTALGAVVLARSAWLAEPNLAFHLTDLVGLFIGSISGILFREILLIFSGMGEVPLPKQSDFFVTQWQIRNPLSVKQESIFFQTPFYFLFWLSILFFCVFLQGFGFSFLKGFGIPDYLYLDGISSRTFLSVPTTILVSIGLPLLYFFVEERFASSSNRENIKKHLFFGLAVGFFIQIFVIYLQNYYLPTFLAAGSNTSLSAFRYPGLFIDSGSSSWMLPLLGIVFIIFLYRKAAKTKEKFSYLIIACLFLILTVFGFHQAKTFWVIWCAFIFISLIWTLPAKWIHHTKLLWTVRGVSFVFTPLLFALLLWSFSKLPSPSPVQELGKRYVNFQTEILDSKSMTAIKSFDETRYELLLVTWEGILAQPWVGNGLGSLPVMLQDPARIGTKISTGLIDVPPNFVLSVLHDEGIFGLTFLLLLAGLFVWERMSYLSILLLLIPLQFGMQVQHADGGFLVLYLLFYPLAEVPMGSRILRISKWFKYTTLILAIGLPLHYFLLYTGDIPKLGHGSEFRKEKIGNYQIQASIFALGSSVEHEFHGNKYEWRLAKEPGFRKGDFVVRTDDKDLQIELIWKNGERVTLFESVMEPATGNRYIWKGTMPAGSEYVFLRTSRKSILKISKNYFSANGEFKL